jgi:hypothetical protein
MMHRSEQAAEHDVLVQALDAPVRIRLRGGIMHRQEQAGQELHNEQRERDPAEAVKVVDPTRDGLVHDLPVPARETHAGIKIVEYSHCKRTLIQTLNWFDLCSPS